MVALGCSNRVVLRAHAYRVGAASIAALLFFSYAGPAAARPVRPAGQIVPAARPEPAAATSRVPARLLTALVAGLADHAGARRAGLMCLPNATLRVRDFVFGGSDFNGIVSAALAAAQPAAAALVSDGTTVSIKLVSIDAKLCARNWGVFGRGDRVSLSGKARVTFDWTVTGAAGSKHETSDVAVEIARSDPAPPDQILRKAVDRLLAIIVAGKPG